MLIVGLTGSIATGKSTVSKKLSSDYQIPIVDADLIAKQIVEPGRPAFNEIVTYFSQYTDNILLENGELNRAEIGRLVFGEANRANLTKLNHITHPRVGYETIKQVLSYYIRGYRMIILDVPLLFEAKYSLYCGLIINVTCDKKTQLERLLLRNPQLTKDEASKRIDSQLPMEKKSRYSDYVVTNDGSLQDLYAQLDAVVAELMPSTLCSWFQWLPFVGLPLAFIRYVQNLFKFKKFAKDD